MLDLARTPIPAVLLLFPLNPCCGIPLVGSHPGRGLGSTLWLDRRSAITRRRAVQNWGARAYRVLALLRQSMDSLAAVHNRCAPLRSTLLPSWSGASPVARLLVLVRGRCIYMSDQRYAVRLSPWFAMSPNPQQTLANSCSSSRWETYTRCFIRPPPVPDRYHEFSMDGVVEASPPQGRRG